jgi:hypothetical protein
MAFVRRPVRLVSGDARPVEEGIRARDSVPRRSNRRGVGLIGADGVARSTLTPEAKAEIESRLRAKWERERASRKLVPKMTRKKGSAGRKKKK